MCVRAWCRGPNDEVTWAGRDSKALTPESQHYGIVGSRLSCRDQFHLMVGVLIYLTDDETFAMDNPDEEEGEEDGPVRALFPYRAGGGRPQMLAVETMPVYSVIRPAGQDSADSSDGGDPDYDHTDDWALETNILNEIIFEPRRDENCNKVIPVIQILRHR